MNSDMKKISLKLYDGETDTVKWIHMCYVEKELWEKFSTKFDITKEDMAGYIADWANEDYNVELSMSTKTDLIILRELIKQRYEELYPLFKREFSKDMLGWTKIWVSQRMEREVLKHERKQRTQGRRKNL